MVFNLAADKNDVGVAIGGSALTSAPLTYTNYTGGYVGIYPGSRTVESFSFSNNGTIASTPFNFTAGKYYSAFVVGNSGTYANVVTLDDIDTLKAGSGKAYVRYINAIPDSTKPTVSVQASESNVFNETAGFAKVSSFIQATPGSLTINISNGGNISANRTINIEAEKIYTVLFTGVPGNTTTPVAIRFVENGNITP